MSLKQIIQFVAISSIQTLVNCFWQHFHDYGNNELVSPLGFISILVQAEKNILVSFQCS